VRPGPAARLLAAGAAALEAGRVEQGVALTLAGLDRATTHADAAAGHSNLCAGYAMLKRWGDALPHCNRAVELDPHNWRSFNNRAAVYVGRGEYELAMQDVNAGLAIAPDSGTLLKSLEVVRSARRLQRELLRHSMQA
jgi:tetratricopeptide (TPR) repeat protein